jgi:cell division protein FtsI (penicillin-binding protein 3)
VFSSNICTYKIADKLGPQKLFDTYTKFGFATGLNSIGFPGESKGRIADWTGWRPVRFANMAFGQGLAVSGLEMVQAYGAIANGGHLTKPFLVERIETSDGGLVAAASAQNVRRVISPETARSLRETLARVVTEGTGGNARSKKYSTGGKTGTAQKVDSLTRKYSADKRIASFIGFTPIQDPHLVIYVVIDEPREKPYYGGTWAAPVFREITDRALEYLNVAPDLTESEHGEGTLATSKDRPAIHEDDARL